MLEWQEEYINANFVEKRGKNLVPLLHERKGVLKTLPLTIKFPQWEWRGLSLIMN
jgi:hypothetical protein